MYGNLTPRRHYQLLAIIMGVAIALRIWHLGTKPLWLDEVIGAIFTLGKGLDDVPLGLMFPITDLSQIFSLNAGLSCPQIAQTVATESVHPPLFFCLQYTWLSHWLPWLSAVMPGFEALNGWVWVLRSLPAFVGIMGVLGLYLLGRMVKGPRTGLTVAALMAVSPFAVYLSQEARHYTLPMLWTILGLIALVRMQQLMVRQRALPLWLLAFWVGVNSLGLYTHYFFLLDFVAQGMAIGGWMVWDRVWGDGILAKAGQRFYQYWSQLGVAIAVVIISYAPWIPTLLQHINRPETDWLKPYKPDWSDRIAPLYQTVMGWILMVISLPVESQPLAIAIPSVLVMVGFGIWLGWHMVGGLRQAWQVKGDRPVLQLFLLLMASLLLQMLAIVYILDKDITAIPRYNFISYPIFLILLSISLSPTPNGKRQKAEDYHRAAENTENTENTENKEGESSSDQNDSYGVPTRFWDTEGYTTLNTQHSKFLLRRRYANKTFPLLHPIPLTLLAGILSAILAIHGIVFQKGYYPHRVAQDMMVSSQESLLVVVSYRSIQEVALGLSFALELEKGYLAEAQGPLADGNTDSAYLMFIDRSEGFGPAWKQLKNAPHDRPLPLNLWAIASPGMKTKNYPATLTIRRPNRKAKVNCEIDPDHFHRIGFPYQLFRCPDKKR